jgi:hypothetical protein
MKYLKNKRATVFVVGIAMQVLEISDKGIIEPRPIKIQ